MNIQTDCVCVCVCVGTSCPPVIIHTGSERLMNNKEERKGKERKGKETGGNDLRGERVKNEGRLQVEDMMEKRG